VHDRYHPRYILVRHDDGTWRRAVLLSQHRVDGQWRVTVSYATAPGSTYWRGIPAEDCRAVDKPPGAGAEAREDGRVLPPPVEVASGGPVTRLERNWPS